MAKLDKPEGIQVPTVEETATVENANQAELEAMQKELEELRAEKAAREQETLAREIITLSEDLEAKRAAEYMEEYVVVRLFKGQEEKYKAPLSVSVNGETILVQRGKDVRMKRKFAEVIKNMEEQNAYAVSLMESLQEDFQEGLRTL